MLVTDEEPSPDILTCGVCQKEFTLNDIVSFIWHKVIGCNKENVQPPKGFCRQSLLGTAIVSHLCDGGRLEQEDDDRRQIGDGNSLVDLSTQLGALRHVTSQHKGKFPS